MTAPATLMLAKILVPETQVPETLGTIKVEVEKPGVNIIDAASRGASDGLHLALNVGAMLIAFIGLIAMVNGILKGIHDTNHLGLDPCIGAGHFGPRFRAHGMAAGREISRLRDRSATFSAPA